MKEKHKFICKVPNNKESEYFIYLFRKYMNTNTYKLRVKGSTPDKAKISKQEYKYRNNIGAIPLKIAKFHRLYLDKI